MRRGDGVAENITKWSWRGGCGEKSRLIRKNSEISAFLYLCRNSVVLVGWASMETGSGKMETARRNGALKRSGYLLPAFGKTKNKRNSRRKRLSKTIEYASCF